MLRPDRQFRKSSFSRIITWCVEVAHDGKKVQVRDSKARDGAVLSFDKNEWDAFIRGQVRRI